MQAREWEPRGSQVGEDCSQVLSQPLSGNLEGPSGTQQRGPRPGLEGPLLLVYSDSCHARQTNPALSPPPAIKPAAIFTAGCCGHRPLEQGASLVLLQN